MPAGMYQQSDEINPPSMSPTVSTYNLKMEQPGAIWPPLIIRLLFALDHWLVRYVN